MVRVLVLDQTKRCCLLDYRTVNKCSYCKAAIAKLLPSSKVLVALCDILLRTFFSKWCTFRSARESNWTCVYSIHMWMDDWCSEDGQRVKKHGCV